MKSPDNDEMSDSLDVFETKSESTEDEKSEGKDEPQDDEKPEEPPFVSQYLPDVTYGTTQDDPQLEDASGGQEITFGSNPNQPELHDASGNEEITATLANEDGSSDNPYANIFVATDPGPDFGDLQWAEDEPTLNFPPAEDDEDDDEDGED